MSKMRLLGMGVMLSIMLVMVIASSASAALPTLLYLSGETGQLLGTGLVTGALNTIHIETELEQLPGTGVRFELTALANDTKLGTYLANYFGVEEKAGAKAKCNSTGFALGEVHISGEWHLVYVALGTQLTAGLLILVPKQSYKCETTKTVTLEGSTLAKLTKFAASGVDQTELGLVIKCAEVVKPELTEYENEAGTKVKAALKLNLLGGNEPGCVNIGSEMVIKFNKMFKVDL